MNAIYSLISLSLIFFVVIPLWNRFRTDLLRQELFALRDSLFLEAAKGAISFDSHGYMATRFVLNGLIRFGHKASLSRILLIMLMYPRDQENRTANAVARAFEASREVDRQLCQKYVQQANQVVARHLGRSPYLIFVSAPFVVASLVARRGSIADRSVARLRRQFSALDQAAYAEGRAINSGATPC